MSGDSIKILCSDFKDPKVLTDGYVVAKSNVKYTDKITEEEE